MDSGSSSTENLIESLSNTLALLTQSYKSHLPQTNNQLRASSKAWIKLCFKTGKLNRGGMMNPGQAKPIKCYKLYRTRAHCTECPRPKATSKIQTTSRDKMLLNEASGEWAVMVEDSCLFLAGYVEDKDEMLFNVLHLMFEVNDSTEASGSKPRSNTKRNRILPAKKENKKEVEVRLRTNKFGNDHLGAIMGYGDYVMGDSVISRVYYVEGLGHNLFSVGQFCDSDLEVAFRKHTCFVRDINGTYILKGSRGTNLYTISIEEIDGVLSGYACCPCFQDLVRGLPRLKFEKDHLCSACQLGKSKKFSHRPKSENTNMEVLHTLTVDLLVMDELQSLSSTFLRNTDLGIKELTTSSLVSVIYHPVEVRAGCCLEADASDSRGFFIDSAHMLFQPMFDVYLEQSRVNELVPSATEINAQVVPPGTSLSTTITQDAPSTSASSSTSDMHHPVRHQEIAEEPTHEDPPINHDVLHPSHNLVTGDPGSAQSLSGNVNSAEPNKVNYPPDHLRRWTKDHRLDNIVGNPSRPEFIKSNSTRHNNLLTHYSLPNTKNYPAYWNTIGLLYSRTDLTLLSAHERHATPLIIELDDFPQCLLISSGPEYLIFSNFSPNKLQTTLLTKSASNGAVL
ncbi:hypothetical protein Tco_0089755 [Tanacetum coccineum]